MTDAIPAEMASRIAYRLRAEWPVGTAKHAARAFGAANAERAGGNFINLTNTGAGAVFGGAAPGGNGTAHATAYVDSPMGGAGGASSVSTNGGNGAAGQPGAGGGGGGASQSGNGGNGGLGGAGWMRITPL